MPVPSLVRLPVVVPITPLIVVLPTPPTVSAWAAPVMPPESVKVPPSEFTRGVAPRVMGPDQVLSLARLRSAPARATPVPMRLVMGSAIVRPLPSISMAAVDATVVPPAAVPRAVLDCRWSTPAVKVVTPL